MQSLEVNFETNVFQGYISGKIMKITKYLIYIKYFSSCAVDVAASFVDVIAKAQNIVILPPFPSVHTSILEISKF